MRSLILQRVAQAVLPVTTLFALYLLVRGHDEPGGGFIAGLVTSSAFVLQAIAFGTEWARRRLRRVVRWGVGVGLAIATSAAGVAVIDGAPFFTQRRIVLALQSGRITISTALVFDVGVYVVVLASMAVILSTLAEVKR